MNKKFHQLVLVQFSLKFVKHDIRAQMFGLTLDKDKNYFVRHKKVEGP